MESSDDLLRVKKFGNDNLFDAFMYFNKYVKEAVIDYNKIFSCIDYIHKFIIEHIKIHKRTLSFKHRDRLLVGKLFEKIARILKHRMLEIESIHETNSKEYNYINKFYNLYLSIIERWI